MVPQIIMEQATVFVWDPNSGHADPFATAPGYAMTKFLLVVQEVELIVQ